MKADLERKVHELLDAGRDPGDDPEIRSAIAGDDDARAEVAALSKLESWLRDWEVSVPEEDLEPIAQRIEQRLDEAIGSFDATAPPEFEDPDAKVSPLGERGAGRSGEYSLDALAGAVDAPSRVQMTGPSPAVALSAPPRPEPKRRTPFAPWVAAAAVVALGVTVSVATLQRADEPAAVSQAAAPAEEAMPGMLPASPGGSAASAEPPEEPMLEMAEAEEAEPMEEEAADEAPETTTGTAEQTDRSIGGARRRRTSRGAPSPMAAATSRSATPFSDRASGGGAAPAEGEAEDRRQAIVERSKAGVRACIGAGTQSAVVMVRFRDGAVRDARVVRPTGTDATNECIASVLRRARLRPEGQQERRTLYYRWGDGLSNAYGN